MFKLNKCNRNEANSVREHGKEPNHVVAYLKNIPSLNEKRYWCYIKYECVLEKLWNVLILNINFMNLQV